MAKKKETDEERKARLAKIREERKAEHAKDLARFVRVLRAAGNVVRLEVPVDPTGERRWRIDVALIMVRSENIAIEIAGRGRHQSIVGFRNDLEKDAESFAHGWTVVRFSREMIASGDALEYLSRRGVRVTKRSA